MRAPSAPPPPPSVDFSRDMVVALFMGERPTGGYAIEVTQIERTDAGLSIRYRTRHPDPSAMQTSEMIRAQGSWRAAARPSAMLSAVRTL